MAQLPIGVTVICISSLLSSLLLESCAAQKVNIQWGPQSMMYLKGKHGKRYLAGAEEGLLQDPQGRHRTPQGRYGTPQGRYGTVPGYQLRAFRVSRPGEILCSENIFIQYLHDRIKKYPLP